MPTILHAYRMKCKQCLFYLIFVFCFQNISFADFYANVDALKFCFPQDNIDGIKYFK